MRDLLKKIQKYLVSDPKNIKINFIGIYDNSPSKNKDDRLSPSSLNQNKESKGEDGLPMIIGSSYKYKLDNYGENKSHNGKFDPQYLIEYLNRYNVNIGALDGKKKERKKNLKTILEAYTKDEKRKSELASRNRYYTGEDSKVELSLCLISHFLGSRCYRTFKFSLFNYNALREP